MIFIVMIVFATGCAHNRATTPAVASTVPASPQNSETPSLSESQKPSDEKNETRDFSDKDLDVLYEEAEAGVVHVADPIAPFNRAMFYFNDKFYFWVLKPVARGYRYIVPTPVRTGVNNFFYNLITPVRMVNCILQGKFYSAGTEFTRFVINSTVGMLGFVDPAKNYPMLKAKEDMWKAFQRMLASFLKE